MKMLTLAILLMSFPWVTQAKGGHFSHDDYERGHNSTFWHDVQYRQHRQESRIARGIDKGQLTRKEVKKLHREQKHVAKQIKHLRRHHYLSRSDKRSVMEHLDHVSKKIKRLKHNDRYAHTKRVDRHRYDYYQPRPAYNKHKNTYRNEGYISRANSNYSTGFYFRF
ncbi:MAG: hypothetical protein ACKE51_03130 [Methylococcaceae bacterium]